MNNRLFAYFDINPTKAYPVVLGNTYSDQYNEEIDSISIVLDDVTEKLDLERPYVFVKIVNKGEFRWSDILRTQFCLKNDYTGEPYDVGDQSSFPLVNLNKQGITTNDILWIKGSDDSFYRCTVRGVSAPFVYFTVANKYTEDDEELKNYTRFTWNGKNYIYMLVDNYIETEKNLEEHIYNYQINLMNTVKLLEKTQCADRMISHSLVNGSRTIWSYIDSYMKFYCPKVKWSDDGVNWEYKYLIDWSGLNIAPFNTTKCADLQMNEPTLRELLTTLMLQVACIPKMDYLKLSFINFKEKPSEFKRLPSMNFPTLSNSSDSYANTLVVSPSQMLDDANSVITENIGFRDTSSVLLKNKENLKLETRFPIYNIKKVYLRNGRQAGIIQPVNQDSSLGGNKFYPVINGLDSQNLYCHYVPHENGNLRIPFTFFTDPTDRILHQGYLKNIKVHFCRYDSTTGKFEETSSWDSGSTQWFLNHNIPKSGGGMISDATWNSQTEATHSIHVATGTSLDIQFCRALGRKMNTNGTLDNRDSAAYINADQVLVWSDRNDVDYLLFNRCTFIVDSWDTYVGLNTVSYTYAIDIPLPDQYYYVTHIWFEYEFLDMATNKSTYHMTSMAAFVPPNPELSGNTWNYHWWCRMPTLLGSENVFHAEAQFDYEYPRMYPQTGDITIPIKIFGAPLSRADITPCFVESSKRALLETDFTSMPSSGTLEDIAKYIYGTVAYQIGSNEIIGFSQMYSQAQAWYKVNTTYFDSILDFLADNGLVQNDFSYMSKKQRELLSAKYGNMPIIEDDVKVISSYVDPSLPKSAYVFDITYQPINNFKMKLAKSDEDIPIPLEQINNTENGLGNFERFINKSQDIVNRIGNNIFQIPQTTEFVSEIQPINSIYNEYTIFKRDIKICEDYVSVLYTASKNYVMQNYFTSIVQKYRAYEYVDYNNSIVRKENTTIFVLISENYYINGDEHVKWVNADLGILLSGITVYDETDGLRYIVKKSINEQDNEEAIKSELSVLTYKNGFCLSYQDFDNVSAGPYLNENVSWSNYLGFLPFRGPFAVALSQIPQSLSGGVPLGGIRQKWQLWKQNEYNYGHEINYATNIVIDGPSTITGYLETVIKFPILDPNYAKYEEYVLFKIVNNDTDKFIFDKDNAEVLNHTVQFQYYTDSKNILWTENFIEHNKMIGRVLDNPNVMYDITNEEFEVQDKPYEPQHIVLLGDLDDFYEVGYEEEEHNGTYTDVSGVQIAAGSDNAHGKFRVVIDLPIGTKSAGIHTGLITYSHTSSTQRVFIQNSRFDEINHRLICESDEFSITVGVPITVLNVGFRYYYTTGISHFIEVHWGNFGSSIKAILISNLTDNVCKDFIAFKRPDNSNTDVRYYISLNDTKTTKAFHQIEDGDNEGLLEMLDCASGFERKII